MTVSRTRGLDLLLERLSNERSSTRERASVCKRLSMLTPDSLRDERREKRIKNENLDIHTHLEVL